MSEPTLHARLDPIFKDALCKLADEPGTVVVNCHFINPGFNKDRAETHRAAFEAAVRAWPEPERLVGGPSYIELGGVIGDQQMALLFMALGEVLGLWKVITPATLGIEGEDAKQLAGSGMVMIDGCAMLAEAVR